MSRGLFRLLEVSTHLRCAVFVHIHLREVTDTELGCDVSGALFIAEDEDVDIRMQACPALDRVALDHPDVPDEGLRQSEERDHGRRSRLREARERWITFSPRSSQFARRGEQS